MSTEGNTVEHLKHKLRSATKTKLDKERQIIVLRNKERVMNDELANIKLTKDFLNEQLEELKKDVVQARYQLSMIDLCGISENIRIQAHVSNMTSHSKSFQDLLERDRKEKEAKIEEFVKQKEKDAAEINEQQDREISTVVAEYEAIEQECAVLEKRNNAIMLKLRRKLLDSENVRRNLMKKCDDASTGATS